MAVLRARNGLNPGQVLPLEGDSIILGRHPDCDIVLESGAVSRQHARVFRRDEQYHIEDLRSRNGTFVNGQLALSATPLAEGDELGICDLTFVFHLGGPEAEPDTALMALMVDDVKLTSTSTIMSKLDVSLGSSGLQVGVNTEAKLKALIQIAQNLGQALSLKQVLPKLLDSLFAIFPQADRGFIVLEDRQTGDLVPQAVKYRRSHDEQTARLSRTIVSNVMVSRAAILSADAAADSRFDMAESIADFNIRSMMCAPLVGSDGNAVGVIQIDALDQRNRFDQEDLDVLASVACQAAVAVENARLHETAVREQALARELAVAHEVQRGLLPLERPDVPPYHFFDFYEAASELGGDYYDYVPLSEKRLAVLVADVSGKGIAASLLMAKLSSETPYCLASQPTPAAAITRLNRIFCESGWESRFVTLVVCVLDPHQHEVTIVNAGHMAPLLRHASGQVEAVAQEQTQLPLGVEPNVEYPQCTLSLAPGDCLTLYTDGISEAMNGAGELYGQQRLWDRLQAGADGVHEIGQAILADVKRFVGNRSQSDDMCLACFGRGA